MNFLLSLVVLLFVGGAAQARCEVALYVFDNAPSSRIIQKMTAKFETILKTKHEQSLAYAVASPVQAQDADYLYLVIPDTSGKISVSVTDLLLNQNLYRNVYNSDAFKSENDVVETMATDFTDEVLPGLKYCL